MDCSIRIGIYLKLHLTCLTETRDTQLAILHSQQILFCHLPLGIKLLRRAETEAGLVEETMDCPRQKNKSKRERVKVK